MRTNEKNRSEEAPENPAFESDRNTMAASERPPGPDADPDSPLPNQEGMKDFPFTELDDREYVDGKEPSEDASAPAPPPTRSPSRHARSSASPTSTTTMSSG